MKERILELIRVNEITAWKFAELLGVQPSSISHIISGRNKPSFDFIEKILLNFPDIDPDWLILGKGEMFRQVVIDTIVENDDVFTSISLEENNASVVDEITTIKEDDENNIDLFTNVKQFENKEDSCEKVSEITNVKQDKSPDIFPIISEISDNEETIEKIIILYKNKKFLVYNAL